MPVGCKSCAGNLSVLRVPLGFSGVFMLPAIQVLQNESIWVFRQVQKVHRACISFLKEAQWSLKGSIHLCSASLWQLKWWKKLLLSGSSLNMPYFGTELKKTWWRIAPAVVRGRAQINYNCLTGKGYSWFLWLIIMHSVRAYCERSHTSFFPAILCTFRLWWNRGCVVGCVC